MRLFRSLRDIVHEYRFIGWKRDDIHYWEGKRYREDLSFVISSELWSERVAFIGLLRHHRGS
jgi:hypothetical protein